MEQTHKVHFTEEKETLLMTLYAKARDNRSKHSLLHDATADELIKHIDYDFKKFDGFENGNVMVMRAKQYDMWINEFLRINPNAVVLNLGCGLDTRINRVNPSISVSWFDVDFPEVIELRENFFSKTTGYEMIGASVTDPAWLEKIPQGRPTLIIAEGVLEYLTAEDVESLLNRLTDRFTHGQIAFDVMNSFAIESGKKELKETTGAVHKWKVDNTVEQVDKLDPKLRRMTELSVFKSPYIRRLPVGFAMLYSVMSLIPRFRNMLRLLRYQF